MKHSKTALVRTTYALALASFLSGAIALGAQIPAFVSNTGTTLVAVEPLLRSLDFGYVIKGSALSVEGRPYPKPLVERSGLEVVDAHDIASFLHLTVTRRNGVLVFAAPEKEPDPYIGPPASADLQAIRAQVLAALNEHRAEAGLEPLVEDPLAQSAAQFQAEDMANAGAMRHEDSHGRSPMRRYLDLGGRPVWYGENVGWYGLDVPSRSVLAAALVKLDAAMMAEQPPNDEHRQTILSTRFQSVGVGISLGPSGIYLAEDFVGDR